MFEATLCSQMIWQCKDTQLYIQLVTTFSSLTLLLYRVSLGPPTIVYGEKKTVLTTFMGV